MHLPLYHLSSTLAGSPIVDPFNGTSYFSFCCYSLQGRREDAEDFKGERQGFDTFRAILYSDHL